MANGNVIPFPGNNSGPGAGFGGVFGTGATSPGSGPTTAAPGENAQAGGAVTPLPAIEQLHARMGATLAAARRATKKLVDKAVPGTVELGLFNQYGIIQNALAEIAARAAQANNGEELAAIGRDLEGVEKQGADYVAAVDAAIAAAPAAMPEGLQGDKRLLWIGGGLAVLAIGAGTYLYLKKPARRKKLAGLFESPEPRKKLKR